MAVLECPSCNEILEVEAPDKTPLSILISKANTKRFPWQNHSKESKVQKPRLQKNIHGLLVFVA